MGEATGSAGAAGSVLVVVVAVGDCDADELVVALEVGLVEVVVELEVAWVVVGLLLVALLEAVGLLELAFFSSAFTPCEMVVPEPPSSALPVLSS